MILAIKTRKESNSGIAKITIANSGPLLGNLIVSVTNPCLIRLIANGSKNLVMVLENYVQFIYQR